MLAGPTASGKSALALQLAQEQGGIIVNADALQVYGNWTLLTARPAAADLARAPHRLYGHVAADVPYSVGHWLQEMAALLATGQRLIVVGGTGLYFRALTEGLAEIPPIPADIRTNANRCRTDLAAMVAALDGETRNRIDLANPVRVQRAWEVLQATGRGLADWQDATPPPLLPPDLATLLVLQPPPDWLADRINRRFDAMMDQGALDEVRANLPGWNPAQPCSKAIGAADLMAHLQGQITLPDAVTHAKAASRHYAKRQRTWFRARMKHWHNLKLQDTAA